MHIIRETVIGAAARKYVIIRTLNTCVLYAFFFFFHTCTYRHLATVKKKAKVFWRNNKKKKKKNARCKLKKRKDRKCIAL